MMEDTQKAANMGNMKTLHEMTKNICNNNATVNDKEGNTITETAAKLTRWEEHFQEILNTAEPANPIKIEVEDVPEIDGLSAEPISKDEVRQGIRALRNGNAGGVNNIAAELLKADLEHQLTSYMRSYT